MFDRPTPWPLSVGLGCIAIAGGWWFGMFEPEKKPKPPEPKPAIKAEVKASELTEEQKAEEALKKAKRDAENIKVAIELAALRQLKSSMKNPASFDIEEALRMDDGSLCVSYRATNSFNAVVPGHAVITASQIIASGNKRIQSEWKKRCAGKTGISVRGLRWFL